MLFSLQIIALIFSLVMLYFAVIHYKKGELNRMEISIWSVIWIITIVAILFPHLLTKLTDFLPFARLFDLLTVGGFILVISMVAVSYLRTKRMEKKLIELVRKNSLSKVLTKK